MNVVTRVKCIDIAKLDHLKAINGPCYIQNSAVSKRVIKRSRCNLFPCKLEFHIIKIGYKGVCISRTFMKYGIQISCQTLFFVLLLLDVL